MKSNGKGHQIRTSGHENERREEGLRAYGSQTGHRVKRIELQKRESGAERTSRNKTVISRHFTHERERLADSPCVPAHGPATVKRLCVSLSLSLRSLFPRSPIPACPFSLLRWFALCPVHSLSLFLHHLHPRPELTEKYCSR